MSTYIGNKLIEPACYIAMILLAVISTIDHTLVPLHIQITVYSLAIITVGSFRSLTQMLGEMKKGLIDGGEASVETVSNKDAL